MIRRRGVIAVSAVLALIILQLAVVGVIVAGARDQNLTVSRVEGTRALYAAEAGFNMALREAMHKVDEDGDGGIGTISDNDIDGDNPALGGVPFSVESITIGESPGVEVKANGLNARRRLQAEMSVMGRRVLYCQWSNQFPQVRIWNGSSFSAPANTLDFSAKQYWMVMKRCPTRNEVIAVCSLQTDILRAAVQTGTAWGNLLTATPNCGTTTSRPFSLAYEQTSGRALMVYRNANSSNINYRIWDGSAWSAPNVTASTISGRPVWMHLVPKRNSNEIILLVQDNTPNIAAMVWDGSSFTNKITLETAAASSTGFSVDAAYERTTGRCLVVWGKSGVKSPQYRIWDGASWSSTAAAPALNAAPVWLKLATDNASAKVMMAAMDAGGRIDVDIWSGVGWGTHAIATPNGATVASRCFDISFEPGGTRGLLMYGVAGQNAPRYRTFDGSGWSNASNAPVLSSPPLLIQLSPSATGSEIMALMNLTGGQNKLVFLRWTGSVMDSLQELEGNVSGPSGAEVFMIPEDPEGITHPSMLRAWCETAPQ